MKIKSILKSAGGTAAAVALIIVSMAVLISTLLASGVLIVFCLGYGYHLGCCAVILLSVLGVGAVVERMHSAVGVIAEGYKESL